MKRLTTGMLIFVMIASMMTFTAACTSRGKEETQNEEPAAAGENKETIEDVEEATDLEAVKSFSPDAKDEIGHDLPMQIETIELHKDGSIRIVLTDDLKKNELDDSDADSIMPFAESGEKGVAEDIYLMRVGNGGYRTLIALMDDGTISAINTRALIEDHIIAVMDNLGGRDSFVSVEQEETDEGFSVIGKTEEGDDVILDPVLLNEDGEVQPVD